MSERPPAPPGYKYNWLGQLREDPDYWPPEGYRLARNFFTNRLEILPLFGEGVNFGLGHNSAPKPAPLGYFGTGLGHRDLTPIDPAKISSEVHAVEGLTSQGSDRNVANRPRSDLFKPRTKEGPAMFG